MYSRNPASGSTPAAASRQQTLSVRQLLSLAKSMLEDSFSGAWVEGEVANFKLAASGHWYFSLKDQDAELKIAMFRGRNLYASVRPENGMLLRVRGRVTVFEARGELQLVAEQLEAAGAGAANLQFEALKAKLAAEGLFDPQRKRSLPVFPLRIALISSSAGAAVHDFLAVIARRYPFLEIEIWPCLMQGESAPAQIVEALLGVALHAQRYQIVVLTRGGGAAQDLAAFNEESVVRALASCPVPTVSAIGHEIDVTLSDFAADVRAATPTAAAELVGVDQRLLQQQLAQFKQRLEQRLQQRIEPLSQRLDYAKRLLDARSPMLQLQALQQRLLRANVELRRRLLVNIGDAQRRMQTLSLRLLARSPERKIEGLQRQLQHAGARLLQVQHSQLLQRSARLTQALQLLQSLNPTRTLERGYVMVRSETGQVLSSAAQTEFGQHLALQFADGSVRVQVQTPAQAEIPSAAPETNAPAKAKNRRSDGFKANKEKG